jgi:hypothetical protein
MAKVYRVVGEWLVKAETSADAENFIENAVAAMTEADLEDCNAELEEEEEDD